MKSLLTVGRCVTALAMVGMFVPRPVLATQGGMRASSAMVSMGDVALQAANELRGIVLDDAGRPFVQIPVTISQNGKLVSRTQTDLQGRFAVAGLRGGVYQVEAAQVSTVARLWAPDTAPPHANDRLVLVTHANDVVRGQGGSRFWQFVTNPWVLGGMVAGAIAIPLALDRDKNGS